MLKITKGLNPYINKDVEDWILTYTDDDGNQYVRVKIGDEDFCIATHDYIKDDKQKFTWNEAMKIVKEIGMSLPTKKQFELYRAHHNEINDKLKEIGDELSADTHYYWSSYEYSSTIALSYNGDYGILSVGNKSVGYRVRPVLVLEY